MIKDTVFFAPGVSGGSNASSLSSRHRRAAIILHEIYGINAHIQRAGHEWMTRGFDIYIPALFPHHTPFRYEQQEEAYRHFSANVGFDPAVVTTLLHELRTQYETLIVVGYSVGATLAWLSAASGYVMASFAITVPVYASTFILRLSVRHWLLSRVMSRRLIPSPCDRRWKSDPWCSVKCTMRGTGSVMLIAPPSMPPYRIR